jgi:hypothetical protein
VGSDWTKFAAVAEVVSSVAVVVTLVYLVIQTQQNFDAINANSREVSIASDLQILATSVSIPGLDLLKFKDEVTDEEAATLQAWLVMLVRSREHEWFQYRDGLLDEGTWRSYLSGLQDNLSTPSTRRWWNAISSKFDPGFSAAVDDYLSTVEIVDEFQNRFREYDDGPR